MPVLLFKVTHYLSYPFIIRKVTKDQSTYIKFTNKKTLLFHNTMLPEGQQMYNLLPPHYLFIGPGVISSINGFSVMTYPTIKHFTH